MMPGPVVPHPGSDTRDPGFAEATEAVLAASRVLVGLAAQSIAAVEESMGVNQFRVMVIIASRGPMHSAGLAAAMGVHPSNATRTCDRLVTLKLLERRENPADRRHLRLTLTKKGRRLVDSVMDRRRILIGRILQQLAPAAHLQLADLLTQFTVAAGEPAEHNLWSMGWITDATGPGPSAHRPSTDGALTAAEPDSHRRRVAGPDAG
jgi:DNA-binding MarR family transcriptional regulator